MFTFIRVFWIGEAEQMCFPKAVLKEDICALQFYFIPCFPQRFTEKRGLEDSCMYVCAQKAFVCLIRFARFIYMGTSFTLLQSLFFFLSQN